MTTDLEDLEYEFAMLPRAEMAAWLEDAVERHPRHALDLAMFAVCFLIDGYSGRADPRGRRR
jgi:hypothetical protein